MLWLVCLDFLPTYCISQKWLPENKGTRARVMHIRKLFHVKINGCSGVDRGGVCFMPEAIGLGYCTSLLRARAAGSYIIKGCGFHTKIPKR